MSLHSSPLKERMSFTFYILPRLTVFRQFNSHTISPYIHTLKTHICTRYLIIYIYNVRCKKKKMTTYVFFNVLQPRTAAIIRPTSQLEPLALTTAAPRSPPVRPGRGVR